MQNTPSPRPIRLVAMLAAAIFLAIPPGSVFAQEGGGAAENGGVISAEQAPEAQVEDEGAASADG